MSIVPGLPMRSLKDDVPSLPIAKKGIVFFAMCYKAFDF